MTGGIPVLIAEDDASLRRVAEYELRRYGYDVVTAEDGNAAWKAFKDHHPEVVVTDLAMPGIDGAALLEKIKRTAPETEVIIITAFGTVDRAVAAMKAGAYDFITKPFEFDQLRLTIERALEHRKLLGENRRLRTELTDRFRPENMVGVSKAMQEVYELIAKVAPSHANVLILGESGTGKELVARAIHHHGPRGDKPFVAINCGAIPHDLIESELFGVTRGAFTGADRDRPGRFERAGEGSVFLDEIIDLPLDLQVKLLRVLQEREIERLGSANPIPIAARFIFATNADIAARVADGSFRSDLYFRLNVVTITVPPLRERREDIIPLWESFAERQDEPTGGALDRSVRDALVGYSWPGNVRELENAVERAYVLRQDPKRITISDLPAEIAAGATGGSGRRRSAGAPVLPETGIDMTRWEKELLEDALAQSGGNKTKAAGLLGMTRQTFLYRLRKHRLR
jgi:two-component system NtrC family response regulator